MGLKYLKTPRPSDIPSCPREFLKSLGSPTVIQIPGRDGTKNRVLLTLTHGNESSGFEVLHQWLQKGQEPATNLTIILGGVEAALTEPFFYYRHLPDKRDLNRCFLPPYNDSQGQLALEILNCIQSVQPEAVVDMHNTSGATPPFCVSFGYSEEKRQLASLFTDSLIISNLEMGALMELDFSCPIITLEVGESQSKDSYAVATRAMEYYFLQDQLLAGAKEITLFYHPLRLEFYPDQKVGYSGVCLKDMDITIRDDIESFNFKTITGEDFLGWVNTKATSPFCVRKADHTLAADDYFLVREGKLYPVQSMTLFMSTVRTDIAVSDCLFYFKPH